MTDDNKVNDTVAEVLPADQHVEQTSPVDPLANIDVNSIDFSKPETIPEVLKNFKFHMPNHGVKRPLWRVSMTNPYAIKKEKTSKLWFNGELISAEEYNKLPAEETFAYRNQIRKSKA